MTGALQPVITEHQAAITAPHKLPMPLKMQHWSDYLDGLQADNVVAVKLGGAS